MLFFLNLFSRNEVYIEKTLSTPNRQNAYGLVTHP